MDFQYKITKFDNVNKVIVVTFADGHWAEIRLTNPLPANTDELDKIIQRYAAPVEVIEAQQAPSADLSYINGLIYVERTAQRFSLKESFVPPSVQQVITAPTDPALSVEQPTTTGTQAV